MEPNEKIEVGDIVGKTGYRTVPIGRVESVRPDNATIIWNAGGVERVPLDRLKIIRKIKKEDVSMKTLKQYLAESKKVYPFKVKLAGEIPKNFEQDLKKSLEKVNVLTFEKMKTTPVQKTVQEFPTLANVEVTIYNVVLEYPITGPEIINHLKEMGLDEEYFRVRGADEPAEYDQMVPQQHEEGQAILDDPEYKSDDTAIEQENLAGPEFNKTFLADLAKASQERKEALGMPCKNDPNVLGTHAKENADKAGAKSAIGSK